MPSRAFIISQRRLITLRGRTTGVQLSWPQKGFMVELKLLGIFFWDFSQPLWESWDCRRSGLNTNEDLEGSLLLWFCLLLLDKYNYEPGSVKSVYVPTTRTQPLSGDYYLFQSLKQRSCLADGQSDRYMIKRFTAFLSVSEYNPGI